MVRSAPLTLCLALAAAGCGDKAPTATDADGDGFAAGEDCDDGDASVHPGAPEVCNGADDDCDGEADEGVAQTWHADRDGDGFGDPEAVLASCALPDGYVADASDCDDDDPEARPTGVEVCDGVDNDCDGETDEGVVDAPTWFIDGDGDGFGLDDPTQSYTGCDGASGYAPEGGDCDDDDPDSHPGAPEACDGVDNDCNDAVDDVSEGDAGAITVYPDGDRDGFGDDSGARAACAPEADEAVVPGDCNDANATVYPDAPEQCETPLDENCDGSRAPCERALADATVRAWGAGAGHRLGVAVVGGMDVNGDGTDDAAFSSPQADGQATGAGEVYVRLGPVTPSGQRVDLIADARISGQTDAAGFGQALATPGDLDGDGRAELLVGAPADSALGDRRGAAHLFRGADLSGSGLDSGDALATWAGESDGDEAGALVASAGDVTGDGIADLLVGARGDDDAATDAGALYLLSGADPTPGARTLADATAKLLGRAEGETVGEVASAAGDLDGDGFGDLLIGAPNAPRVAGDNVGVVWLVRGPVTGAVGLGDADATLEGAAALAFAGATTSGGGDVDGDGYDDFFVGSPGIDTALPAAGAVYLIAGVPTVASLDEAGLADVATATIAGEHADGQLGLGLAAGGDLDGDGAADLLVGAYTAAGVAGGVVYGFLGPLSGALVTADAQATLFSGTSGDDVGASVSFAGSIGSSTVDGVLIGLPGADDGGAESGAVTLLPDLRL